MHYASDNNQTKSLLNKAVILLLFIVRGLYCKLGRVAYGVASTVVHHRPAQNCDYVGGNNTNSRSVG